MKIFLTGGNGMVGRNIINTLNAQNHEIISPARSKLDLNNERNLYNALKEFNPEIVIHAAGKVGGIQANIKKSL